MSAATEAKADDLAWLRQFRAGHPDVIVLAKAQRPVAYLWSGPVYADDLHQLRLLLDDIYSPLPPPDG